MEEYKWKGNNGKCKRNKGNKWNYALGKKTVPGLVYQKKGSYTYKLPDTCSSAKDGVVSYKWQKEEDFLTTSLIIKPENIFVARSRHGNYRRAVLAPCKPELETHFIPHTLFSTRICLFLPDIDGHKYSICWSGPCTLPDPGLCCGKCLCSLLQGRMQVTYLGLTSSGSWSAK